MGDFARRAFARTTAVLGLAAATVLALTGIAAAVPADRAGDPVVLTGSELPGLTGSDPDRVVAYKWDRRWVQVPVQIDERHTVSARDLYPEIPRSKYVLGSSFDIEVYADAKTRSGADRDTSFDADDELVFMAGDSGSPAPAVAVAPPGVVPASATRVRVDDPVGGGNSFVYLFRANRQVDQSAGRSYVSYDFKLTGLAEGQTMLRDYGYYNATNPEDSTVRTANYELHSTGRWMEDEMRIRVGGASGVNILDREAVSAGGLNGCGRSEYTFSGNWHLDTNPNNDRPDDDDEGTYLAVKDGPVRAIRSFMGANSGPYVQADHKYYADREDKSIYVRVHPIPDMYVWTDYAESAIGMTYRDQANRGGFPVDGEPDPVQPPAPGEISDGRYFWQQLTGSQGSVTTLVAAETSVIDADNPPYVSYYLDDSTPTGPGERQCGGDLKAYGASGFGIDGVFPNTDPVLGPAFINTRDLAVNRVRYFGGPGATAADADALRSRAQHPLAASASKAPIRRAQAGLRVRLLNGKVRARRGKPVRLRLRLVNRGNVDIRAARVCVRSRSIVGQPCRRTGRIPRGKARQVIVNVRVRPRARGKRVPLAFRYAARADGSGAAGANRMRIALRR